MSIRQDIPSLLVVRRWTTKDVLSALQQNGLGGVLQSFRKRSIDGDTLLRLTELQLTTEWNNELSLTNIRKITKFIDDIKTQTGKRSPSFSRPTKPFDGPRIPVIPQCSPRPMLITATNSDHWSNRGRTTGVAVPASIPQVFGSLRDSPPVPPASRGQRDLISAPTALRNRLHLGPVPPVPENRRGHSPTPVSSTSGNRCDPSPITIPAIFGDRRETSTLTTLGVASIPCPLAPSSIQGRKPKFPVPSTNPQFPYCKNVIACSGSDEDGSRELSSMLQRDLRNTIRTRTGSPQNGLPTAKPEEAAVRPLPKPPAALRPQPPKPFAHLPMPPPMTTGLEDEHMKEIVSNIQIPSVPPKVNEINGISEEMSEKTSVGEEVEIYEELDMEAWATEQNEIALRGGEETPSEEIIDSGIYEYIPEDWSSAEYYVEPMGAVNASAKAEFESTHVQVEELPVAPSIPKRPQGVESSFKSKYKLNLRSQIFRKSETKPSETQPSRENNLLTTTDKLEEEPKKFSISRSSSPNREKITVSSELRKSPSSSTTSLITPNKGNAGQASALPDQRLPPNLRPLPPTPGISSFRSGPPSNTATVSRKINSKAGFSQQPWYHNVDRRRGEEIVCNREDGTFLIRPSTQNQNPYTLTIWFGKRVYNIAIRFRPDQKFALGSEKPNEQSFRSLEDMVAYYQTEQLVLYSGGERTGQTSLKTYP